MLLTTPYTALTAVRPAYARNHRRHAWIGEPVVWILAWLGLGLLALWLVPALRGSAAFGATLPFWLVGAPLLDLVWLGRFRLATVLRSRPRRDTVRQARRIVPAAGMGYVRRAASADVPSRREQHIRRKSVKGIRSSIGQASMEDPFVRARAPA